MSELEVEEKKDMLEKYGLIIPSDQLNPRTREEIRSFFKDFFSKIFIEKNGKLELEGDFPKGLTTHSLFGTTAIGKMDLVGVHVFNTTSRDETTKFLAEYPYKIAHDIIKLKKYLTDKFMEEQKGETINPLENQAKISQLLLSAITGSLVVVNGSIDDIEATKCIIAVNRELINLGFSARHSHSVIWFKYPTLFKVVNIILNKMRPSNKFNMEFTPENLEKVLDEISKMICVEEG